MRAGGDRCPDSFAPISARFAASALRDPAVDHHESNRLFRQIVRRYQANAQALEKSGVSAVISEEAEVSVALLRLLKQMNSR